MKKYLYKVKGMHCASCEVLIEKKLLELDGIEFVDASLSDESVLIGYTKTRLSVDTLNHLRD